MSLIPRRSNVGGVVSKIPRLAQKSNIPTHLGKKVSGKTGLGTPAAKSTPIFITSPTMQAMEARSMPENLLGRPKIYGHPDQTNSLYDHVMGIAQSTFTPHFVKVLFPNALSLRKNHIITSYAKKPVTKIPQARRSSIAPGMLADTELSNEKLNLTDAFDQLKKAMRTQRSQMLAITDFCILYPALVLLVADNEDTLLQALLFLKSFLQLEVPQRPPEIGILLAVLARQCYAEPKVRGHALDVVAIICDMRPEIRTRVEAGLHSSDQSLADFCREALKLASGGNTVLRTPMFAEIPHETTASVASGMMSSFIEALDAGNAPQDPIPFIANVLEAMKRFKTEASVLEKGSGCLDRVFGTCTTFPVEIISWTLELCCDVLSGQSFLNGDDSFDAVEAVQNLGNILFEKVPQQILLAAVAGTVAQIEDAHLPLLMNKLKEYVRFQGANVDQLQIEEIAATLDAFHPNFTGRPDFLVLGKEDMSGYDRMAESVRRLMDPETVFQEMEAIVAMGDSTVIQSYPTYLRTFLQRAFYLLRQTEPDGLTDHERRMVEDTMESYRGMTPEDLAPGGQFSADALATNLAQLRDQIVQSW